jgi:STE24 endopeptidase
LFAVGPVVGLLVKFWLASRQIRHVARHRTPCLRVCRQTVTLHAHQKAADYTVAKAALAC